MSLRLQLILLTTLVLLVSLLLGGLLTYGYARSKVRAEMHAAMAVGQRMARNAIADAGLNADPAGRTSKSPAQISSARCSAGTTTTPR